MIQNQTNGSLQVNRADLKKEVNPSAQNRSLSAASQEISRERCITSAEFQQVVDYACMLQKLDVERETNQQKTLEAFAQFDPERGVPLSVVSKVVDEAMHIGKPYVEQAIALYFPSKEQVEQDLRIFNARPTRDSIYRDYKKEISRAFAEKMPAEKIVVPLYFEFGGDIYLCHEEIKTFKFGPLKLSRKKEIQNKLACFSSASRPDILRGDIYLYDPIFLRVCGEALHKLDKKHEKFLKFTYHFNYSV